MIDIYTASTALTDAINSTGRKCIARILIDNSVIDADIIGFTYNTGCSNSNSFNIGTTASAYLELKINTDISFQDVIFKVDVGFYTANEEFEYVTLGTFKTFEAYAVNNVLEVKAYDKMYYEYEDTFIDSLTYPTTIESVINAVADTDTVIFKGVSSTQKSNTVTINYNYTRRKLLEELCICLGAFAYINNVGNLVISRFGSDSSIAITADNYYAEGFKTASESIDIVNIVNNSTEEVFTTGSGKGIYTSSDLITQDIFNALSLLNTTFNSGTVKIIGNPLIELSDYLTVADVNILNGSYKFFPTLLKHVYNGGFVTYVDSYTVQDSETISELEEVKKIANKAFISADGKNSCYVQTTTPLGTDFNINDMWFDTDNDNKLYTWNGTTWVAKQYGSDAIAAGAVTTNHLVAGAVTAAKIASHTITANEVDIDNLFAQNINFTGVLEGGDISGSSVIKSNNYDYDISNGVTGFQVRLDTGEIRANNIILGKDIQMHDIASGGLKVFARIYSDCLVFGLANPYTIYPSGTTGYRDNIKDVLFKTSLTARKTFQSGRVSITPTANAVSSKSVTFSEEMAGVPNVLVTAGTSGPFSEVKGVSVSNVTSTGFTVNLYRTNTVTTGIHWFAHVDVNPNSDIPSR